MGEEKEKAESGERKLRSAALEVPPNRRANQDQCDNQEKEPDDRFATPEYKDEKDKPHSSEATGGDVARSGFLDEFVESH